MPPNQKVDGVLRKDIEMTSIVPKINNDYYDLVKFDGEYIEELELYLIFNIRSNQNLHNNFWDDYQGLKEEHPITKDNSIEKSIIVTSDTSEMIVNKMEREIVDILEFCHHQPREKKWWPKVFYQIQGDNKRRLEVLQIIGEKKYTLVVFYN